MMKKARHLFLALLAVLLVVGAEGCERSIGPYRAASTISRHGFAHNRQKMLGAAGRRIRVWGFVDYANVYPDGPGGDEQDGHRWRFDLKAEAADEPGESFPVYVFKDRGRERLLEAFAENERAGKPTRVFITGIIHTFDAPTNFSLLTGLYLEVASSRDVRLEPGVAK